MILGNLLRITTIRLKAANPYTYVRWTLCDKRPALWGSLQFQADFQK